MADKEGKVKHGRRSEEEREKPTAVAQGWGDEGGLTAEPTMGGTADTTDPVDLPTIEAGVDEGTTQSRAELEDMSKEVAEAPTEYHSHMPKLADLESSANNKWLHIHRAVGDLDISCLTTVLCSQLDDEDVAWNPDQMLVQLTSEMTEAKIQKAEDDTAVSTAL